MKVVILSVLLALTTTSAAINECSNIQISGDQLTPTEQTLLKTCIDNGTTPVSLVPFIVVGRYEPPADKIAIFVVTPGSSEPFKILWFNSTETDTGVIVDGQTRASALQEAFKIVRRAYKNAQKFVGSAVNAASKPITNFFGRQDVPHQ